MIKKRVKYIFSCFLVLVWMLVIFDFSNANTEKSNNQSKEAINKIVNTTIDTSKQIGILDNIPTEVEKQSIIEILNKPLRKCMHFTIYFVLAILILNALNQNNIKHKYLITIIICFLYAITDEYHQTFISGRTGQFSDVIIDTTGSVLYLIIHKLINKTNNKKYKI